MVSFDSTMRSNVSVGMPIDLACYVTDSYVLDNLRQLPEGDPYFTAISGSWSEGLRNVFASLPDPEWVCQTSIPAVPDLFNQSQSQSQSQAPIQEIPPS